MSQIQVIPPGEKPGPEYHIRVLPVERKHSFQITTAHGNWSFVKPIWDELYQSKIDLRTKAPVEMGWLLRGGKFNAAMDSCDGGELVARFNPQEGLVVLFNPEPETVEEVAPEIEEPESITFGTALTNVNQESIPQPAASEGNDNGHLDASGVLNSLLDESGTPPEELRERLVEYHDMVKNSLSSDSEPN